MPKIFSEDYETKSRFIKNDNANNDALSFPNHLFMLVLTIPPLPSPPPHSCHNISVNIRISHSVHRR